MQNILIEPRKIPATITHVKSYVSSIGAFYIFITIFILILFPLILYILYSPSKV